MQSFCPMLIEGRYGLITSTIGFFKADAQSVAREFGDWQARCLGRTFDIQSQLHAFASFSDVVAILSPLSSSYADKWLFLPVGNGWTAMFSNDIGGLDSTPIGTIAVNLCATMGIRMTLADRRNKHVKWPGRIVEVFEPQAPGPFHHKRVIACSNDGGRWTFHATGSPYPFENAADYDESLKSKRFSTESLIRFLKNLGLDVEQEKFWTDHANCGCTVVHRIRRQKDLLE